MIKEPVAADLKKRRGSGWADDNAVALKDPLSPTEIGQHLTQHALDYPRSFMPVLGRVMPLQINLRQRVPLAAAGDLATA